LYTDPQHTDTLQHRTNHSHIIYPFMSYSASVT